MACGQQPSAFKKNKNLQSQSLSQRPCYLRLPVKKRSLPTPSAAVCNHFMPRGIEDAGALKRKIEFWPVTTIKYNNLSLQGWFRVQEEVQLWWEATSWTSVKLTFGVFATGGLLTTEGTMCVGHTKCKGVLKHWPGQKFLTPVTLNCWTHSLHSVRPDNRSDPLWMAFQNKAREKKHNTISACMV